MPGACEDIVAPNQGGHDLYVTQALAQFGAKLVIGTKGSAGGANSQGSRIALGEAADGGSTITAGPWMSIPGGVFTESATAANIRLYVQNCVAGGAIFGNYHHRLSATTGPLLDAYFDEMRLQQAAGLLDICTPSEIRDYLQAFKPVLVPILGTAI